MSPPSRCLVAVTVLDASTFVVAVLTAAAWLPWLLVGLPAGAWVDRLPRRPVMIVCDLASALLFLSVPVAAAIGALTVTQLLVVALGAGLARVFFETADQVYLPVLLRREQVPEGNAKLQATQTASYVLGPGLAGVTAQLAGAVTALLLDALSFLFSAACLLRIRTVEPRPEHAGRSRSLRREIGEGLRFVARDPYLRVLTAFGAASNVGLVGYQAVLVVFLVREARLAPAPVGALVAAMSLGGIVGALLATTLGRRLGSARAMFLAAAFTGPPALLIPLAGPGEQLALPAIGGCWSASGWPSGTCSRAASGRPTPAPTAGPRHGEHAHAQLRHDPAGCGAGRGGRLGVRSRHRDRGDDELAGAHPGDPADRAATAATGPARRAEAALRRAAAAAVNRPPPPARIYRGRTLSACGPFCPWVTSNSTFWPSFSSR